jgi:thiol-disulfide isomerase/thioredoxin
MKFILILALCFSAFATEKSADITQASVQAILKEVRKSPSEFTIVNIWATWCPPCRKEFPALLNFKKKHPEVSLQFVSGDSPEDRGEVGKFLREQKVNFTTYQLTPVDENAMLAFNPTWSGGLPATFFFRKGEPVAFVVGETTVTKLEKKLKELRQTPAKR